MKLINNFLILIIKSKILLIRFLEIDFYVYVDLWLPEVDLFFF